PFRKSKTGHDNANEAFSGGWPMRLRRVLLRHGMRIELQAPHGWVPVAEALKAARLPDISDEAALTLGRDPIALLALARESAERLADAAAGVAPIKDQAQPTLPFTPRSFRDFMLYET